MAKVAFELRADADDFSGGSVSLPGGEAFDVKEALSNGGGKIVLNAVPGERKDEDGQRKESARAARDAQIVEALAAYPVLKTAAVDAPAKSKSSEGSSD